MASSASGLDHCDASGGMWNEDMTQPVAAITTELKDHLSDIGDRTSSGTQLHDIHFPIVSGDAARQRFSAQRHECSSN